MFLKFNKIDDKLVVTLVGELDHHSAEEVRVKIDDRIERDNIKKVIMDFKEVTFMDSSGIGLILGRVRQIHPINGKVYLFGGNEIIRKMLDMSGIQNVVTVLDTIEEVKEVYE